MPAYSYSYLHWFVYSVQSDVPTFNFRLSTFDFQIPTSNSKSKTETYHGAKNLMRNNPLAGSSNMLEKFWVVIVMTLSWGVPYAATAGARSSTRVNVSVFNMVNEWRMIVSCVVCRVSCVVQWLSLVTGETTVDCRLSTAPLYKCYTVHFGMQWRIEVS